MKKRMPLTTLVPVMFALIMTAAFAIVGAVSARLGEENVRQSIRAFSAPIAQSSARALFNPLHEGDAAQASVILSRYADGQAVAYAAMFNHKGIKLAETLRGWTPDAALVKELAAQALETNAPAEKMTSDYLLLSAPIAAGEETLGAVAFAFNQRELRASFQTNLKSIMLYSLFITLGASLLTYLVARFELRPLAELTAAARRIGAGELRTPVKTEGAAEIALLAESIEAMRVELAKSYQNLREAFAGLEWRVTERTAAAEAARARLEEQVWLAQGQTAVSDAMRGEQTPSQLAQNVVSQLCAYMRIQSGALFLLDGDALTLKGGYAVSERAGVANVIRVGDGLIGQAAADGEPRVWSFPETGARFISTALADFKPRAVLAFPFFANGRVIGVVELASFSPFEEKHFELLRRLSETIGMGFIVSQTRQRLISALSDRE